MRSLFAVLALATLVACGPSEVPGTQVLFDLDGDLAADHFFDAPWPSDLRVVDGNHPDLTGFPNPPQTGEPNALVERFRGMAAERRGFPMVPAAYFRFGAPIAAQDATKVIEARASGPVLLVDVDPASPTVGKLYPLVASTLPEDAYVPSNLLALAPRPGIVLPPRRTFAFVVLRSLRDASGNLLGVPLAVAKAAHDEGLTRKGSRGALPEKLAFAPVWEKLGIDADDVAALTVFTTGDVVDDLRALSDSVKQHYSVTIDGLHLDPDDGKDHPRFCELLAHVKYPQFQKGTPPFDKDGLFEIGADGLPVRQRDEDAAVVITLPKAPMPEKGYRLMAYFHGSGGLAAEVVDRGKVLEKGGEETKGEGPAHVVAPFGLATATAAFPLNPDRLPGASDFAYLNLNNLNAVRDTFRQGVLEQRMFLEALRTLEIPPEKLAGCLGPMLPAGATAFKFDPDQLVAMGHSMGAMYLNMITAIEPRIRAIVASGAGGYWTYFLMETKRVPNAPGLLGSLLGADPTQLNYLHPAMQLAEAAIETVDPLVFTPRVARRPLPGFTSRPIYQPMGLGDSYFPPQVLDTIALGYGNRQAGKLVWQSTQDALQLDGLNGLLDYPISNELTSEAGAPYTGVAAQYEGDGLKDPHSIAFQLDTVKYQYGCFLDTFLSAGKATVPAPAALGTPCPR